MRVPNSISFVAWAFTACASHAGTQPSATVPAATVSKPTPGAKLALITLYQPDDVLRSRAQDTKKFANYVSALQGVSLDYFAAATQPETLHVVVAVKPGKHARVWFVSDTRSKLEELAPLRDKLQAVDAVEVFHGPVAFALQIAVAGGGPAAPHDANGDTPPPIPKEWLDSIKGEEGAMTVPDDFLHRVWPDEAGSTAENQPAPPGFVNKVLEPFGGVIFMPKDWFFAQSQDGPSVMWTLSKEDSNKGGYTTGVRIQAVVGVKKHTGQSPEAFIKGFLQKKRKEASRVVKDCGAGTEQGLFKRLCLETEEGPYHIHYSTFFSTTGEADMAVVMTAGTTKELWPQLTATFDTMAEFQLLDMKHLQKQIDQAH